MPEVFISYSTRDEKYKDELLRHLRILEKQGVASFWDTSLIPAGGNWSQEIEKAIDEARVAVLLISPDFLTSDYVVERELPLLLRKAEARNMVVLPVLVRHCAWTSVPALAQFQFLNDISRPLSECKGRDDDFAQGRCEDCRAFAGDAEQGINLGYPKAAGKAETKGSWPGMCR